MSLRYRSQNGTETIVSGLTPGGDIEAGAVMTRTGQFVITDIPAGGRKSGVVIFDSPMPDNEYSVELELKLSTNDNLAAIACSNSAKTANGFQVFVSNNATAAESSVTLTYTAWKIYSVQHAAQNAADIAEIKAAMPAGAGTTNKLTTTSQLNNAVNPLTTAVSNIQDVVPSDASITNKLVSQSELSDVALKTFVGTTAEWNDLTPEEQAVYDAKDITDDFNGSTIDLSPTPSSPNLVSSGGVYTAINGAMNGDCIIISASYGVTPSASVNFLTYLKPMLTTVYRNVYDSSIGGASFSNGQYLSLIQGLASTVTEKHLVRTIVVVGIGNDINAAWADVLNAMITFRAYCNTNYPNAKIIIAPVSTRSVPTEIVKMYDLFNQMSTYISSHRMSIMRKAYHILALNYTDYVSSDGVHPTEVSAKIIADAIYNNLCGSDYGFEFYYESNQSAICDNPKTTGVSTIGRSVKSIDNCYITCLVDFQVTEEITVSANWGSQFNLKKAIGFKPPTSMSDFMKANSWLLDKTSGDQYIVRGGIEYDSTLQDFYIGFIANMTPLTLVTGHAYRFRISYYIPFTQV